ncbi:cyclase family protein [Halothermothrix orenii H 168]|uniref:Cyclase family protein n=2 Tax=Halothermothrix orenii TaxID=31909 RepID=B8CXS9_HALOH|nr:cyclase family protein [Halothermothrix orenii H 168]
MYVIINENRKSEIIMGKFIDLSQEIIDNMNVHPYDDKVKLYQDKYLEEDEYNNFRLEIGMHAGTHIDTPMHLTDRKIFISEIPLEKFAGSGCLLDVRDEKIIGFKQEYIDVVNENDIVILYTGYSDKYGTDEYYTNHPVISEALADFLVDKNIKMLGMDMPSPDNYPFEIHKKLFKNNILIIENLTNLSELVKFNKFNIIAFPLKIKAEASMVRVVANIEL